MDITPFRNIINEMPVIGESSSGYDNIFRGIIKCADCGSAMLAEVEQKKELRQCKQRVSEIENLYAKLYEDLTRELITEKRFQMLSARYDSKQEELTAKIKELEKSAIAYRDPLSSIEHFAEQISGYVGITEL